MLGAVEVTQVANSVIEQFTHMIVVQDVLNASAVATSGYQAQVPEQS
ncbi:hypothetical protein L687_04550 [Microbacterium maritypicum MF109]|uniref:Uncharacterized protein n=1 Tax=Microbacterium maritypicum MF109 TaxID=1333857 RepID=T5KE20_MICMQ|nr:hypothetical protein L687_04550 [Microbacterium maritypicum MF109]